MNDRSHQQQDYSRRQFIGGALGVAASMPFLETAVALAAKDPDQPLKPATLQRKIKLGQVGCGGRGSWIASLFQQHGGYEMHTIADYFPEVADRVGQTLGVDKRRRFSGLSGYHKAIESGVEAIVLETPVCFFPDHATAAVEAGLHVYMAKPVAVDVPGCLRIEKAGKLAAQKQRVFLVDYQIPTDPANIEVVKRIQAGDMGKLARVSTRAIGGGHADPPKTATIESRLQNLTWTHDLSLGGGFILTFDVHAIDAALWALGQRPISAMGHSCICRSDPHGDGVDVSSILFEYADGLVHDHFGQGLPNATPGDLGCRIYSETAHAYLNYYGAAKFQKRLKNPFSADVVDLYPAGAKRNIAAFYDDILAGRFENATVRRAVDGCLTGILGREAAARHGRLTMEELLTENRRVEVDYTGLKA
jgi:myo-inositol 2-dehydrogenase / D-chiro-inositol 1-dehydrogenase